VIWKGRVLDIDWNGADAGRSAALPLSIYFGLRNLGVRAGWRRERSLLNGVSEAAEILGSLFLGCNPRNNKLIIS